MSECQTKSGHSVTVFTLVDKAEIRNPEVNYSIVKIKKSFSLLGNSVALPLFLLIYKNRFAYDVIHAHSHLFFSTNICALVRRLGSSPLVITNHGIMSASAPDWFNRLYLKTIGRLTLNSADRIICYTDDEKEKLIHMLKIDREKITVISNGVNTDLFTPNPYHIRSDDPLILWVGRFVPGKGIYYLLNAIKDLKTDIPNIHVELIGEGPLQKQIEEIIIALNLGESVTIRQFEPYNKMPEFYQKCDIFVLPSLHEGVPRTVLEAMACGKPIVISEFTHLKKLTTNAGLTFPKGDVKTLTECMLLILQNPEFAQKLGNTARQRIKDDYSWDITVGKTCDLFKRITNTRENSNK
jgi:glycosyltransferase involved in cell wall biosynthesis